MDKELSKKIFKNDGIKVPDGKIMSKNQILKKDPFKRPFIIKPVSEGSSFGVNILLKKILLLKKQLNKIKEKLILVEEYIEGSDYTVALMNGKVLGILEIIPNKSFYNFSAKYNSKETFIDTQKKHHLK